MTLSSCATKESRYNSGKEAMSSNNWDEAIECFSGNDYENSEELLSEAVKEKGMNEKSDSAFLKDMGVSLMKRYEKSEQKSTFDKTYPFIELTQIGKYKNADFYDPELKKLAGDYINGVELEIESFEKDVNYDQLKYYEGHAKRFKTLKALTDNYGFLKNNVDYMVNYYNMAEKEEKRYSAYKAVLEDLEKQFNKNPTAKNIENTLYYAIKIKNNTKYTYDMEVSYIFYDINECIVGTDTVNYYNIIAGRSYDLNVDFPVNANTYDIYYYSVDFDF